MRHRRRKSISPFLVRAAFLRVLYPPPSQFEAWFVSTAHRDDDFSVLATALAGALDEAGA